MICPRCHGNGVYDRIDAKVMRGVLLMDAPVEVPCDEPDCKAVAAALSSTTPEAAE